MWAQSLGQKDPLEEDMVTNSSIHAWKIPWTEEPDRLQSMGSQRVGQEHTHTLKERTRELKKRPWKWEESPRRA